MSLSFCECRRSPITSKGRCAVWPSVRWHGWWRTFGCWVWMREKTSDYDSSTYDPYVRRKHFAVLPWAVRNLYTHLHHELWIASCPDCRVGSKRCRSWSSKSIPEYLWKTGISLSLSHYVQCGDHELYLGAHVCWCISADRTLSAASSWGSGAHSLPEPSPSPPAHPSGSADPV